MNETEGRGRLSSMDLVPDHAQSEIVWAIQELNKRERSQEDIRFELNDRLAALGVGPISKSAFNRRSMRLAALRRKITMSREIFAGLADEFTADKVDENTVALGEVIKMTIADLVSDGEDRSTKEVLDIARAFSAITTGQKASTERRQKIRIEEKAKAAAAIDTLVKNAEETGQPVDKLEMLRKIREDVYGVFEAPPA
ncbi:phage protein Gp27 family protein [Hansschlegelia zhihuaiae]|uniref:DUF3486 family protein n=1 Tax=Hansschlegelia zhihuaiae TaxID=405005 RepID=A0A4Q0MPI9_9HYPH|nr:phage protein Gp27 family protein [Hansschlegelia zhihuaiae]RXF75069.1 DUF3486 family protein [Hansschlegelia zhihuaiae]